MNTGAPRRRQKSDGSRCPTGIAKNRIRKIPDMFYDGPGRRLKESNAKATDTGRTNHHMPDRRREKSRKQDMNIQKIGFFEPPKGSGVETQDHRLRKTKTLWTRCFARSLENASGARRE
jgi:hypothetical protein